MKTQKAEKREKLRTYIDAVMESSNKNSLTQTIGKTIDQEYILPKNIEEFAKAKHEPKQEVKIEVKRSKSLLKASRAINRMFTINLMKEQNIFSKIIALKRNTTSFDNLILEKSATSASRLELPKQF